MKVVKLLTIVAIATFTIATANEVTRNYGNQYNIEIGNHAPRIHKQMRKRVNPIKRLNRIFRSLNLTEEQKTKLAEIRKTMRKNRKANMQKLKKENGLKKYITVDGFDKAGFLAVAQKRSKIMLQFRADMFEKIIAILTPEQREKLILKLGSKPKNN